MSTFVFEVQRHESGFYSREGTRIPYLRMFVRSTQNRSAKIVSYDKLAATFAARLVEIEKASEGFRQRVVMSAEGQWEVRHITKNGVIVADRAFVADKLTVLTGPAQALALGKCDASASMEIAFALLKSGDILAAYRVLEANNAQFTHQAPPSRTNDADLDHAGNIP